MNAACLHPPSHSRPSEDEVRRDVAAAADRAEAAGERMTRARQRVFELLVSAGEPVKAYDLIARFHTDGRVAKPATVYRALDFLEKLGLLHRVSSISSYVACSGGYDRHAAAFLICDCCGQTREIASPQDAALRQAAQANGFSLERTILELHGRCSSCVTP